MTADDVRQLMRDEIKRIGIGPFAKHAGVTRSHICAVLNGGREPRGAVLDAVGIDAVVTYRLKESE